MGTANQGFALSYIVSERGFDGPGIRRGAGVLDLASVKEFRGLAEALRRHIQQCGTHVMRCCGVTFVG